MHKTQSLLLSLLIPSLIVLSCIKKNDSQTGTENPSRIQRILFEREGFLYLSNIDPVQPQQLFSGVDAELSPNGSMIAYTRYGEQGERDIAVYDIVNETTTAFDAVPHHNSFAPRWSPDGEWLAFQHYTHNTWVPGVIRRDGKMFKALEQKKNEAVGSVYSVAWGADGKSVWCHNMETMYRIDLDGNVVQSFPLSELLGEYSNMMNFSSADRFSFSRDGKRLLFSAISNEGMGGSIFVRDFDAGTTTQITPMDLLCEAPSWLPGEKGVVFAAGKMSPGAQYEQDMNVQHDVYICSPVNGNPRTLIPNGAYPSCTR